MSNEITIDLDDVIRAGGVVQALHAWCETSDDTSSGVVGPSYSTSGPGSGWSIQYDESDYARRAIVEGAMYYLAADGRIVAAARVDEDERDGDDQWPTDTFPAMDGCHYRLCDWTDESVVCLVCPDADDAVEYPRETAEMAQAVIDYHHYRSDVTEWHRLILAIRTAADVLGDIDLSSLLTR